MSTENEMVIEKLEEDLGYAEQRITELEDALDNVVNKYSYHYPKNINEVAVYIPFNDIESIRKMIGGA